MSMRLPFQQRPFIRFRDGSLVLLSPSLLHEWLTDGFHYRALDAVAGLPPAKARSGRYLRFAGHVFERYCVDLAKRSHHIGFGTTPLVSADVTTTHGEQRTVDLLVAMGSDLVLVEIEHHRPGLPVSVHGSSDAAVRDLRDHLLHKIERRSACIAVLRDRGGPNVQGLDMRRIRHIWPIVLTAEAPPHQPPLWDFFDREAGGMLKELGAEPLTIVDVEDFEMLCGVVETAPLAGLHAGAQVQA